MTYIPKRKNLKLNYKIAIPLLVLVVLVGYFFVNSFAQKQQEKNELYTVCGFNNEKSKSVLDKTYKETYEISDYLFYGESLALFKDPYMGMDGDALSGKTLKLKDVCSNQTYAFVLDSKVDRKVMLGNIKPGFYEMYVVEDLKEKRVYATTAMNDSINTVTRDGKNTNVEFMATQDILSDYGVQLAHPYAYLKVSETTIAENQYDIVIDPAGNDSSFSYGSDASGNGLEEAKEAYEAAVLLKEKLEAKGLKVLLLRDAEQSINTYGADGRLAKAYEVGAKYYIRLAFLEDSSTSLSGFTIFHSEHTTKMLASQIGYDLGKQTALQGSTIYMGVNDDPGVISAGVVESELDGRAVYDNDLWVREVGGKATQAGMYSQNTIEGTASFAKDNLHGLNGLNIYLGYLSNAEDASYWQGHKDLITDVITNGITTYLNIE